MPQREIVILVQDPQLQEVAEMTIIDSLPDDQVQTRKLEDVSAAKLMIAEMVRKDSPPDLIWTDWLPDFLNWLRESNAPFSKVREIPVIVASNLNNPMIKDSCNKLGVESFIEEPFDIQQAMAEVRRVLAVD